MHSTRTRTRIRFRRDLAVITMCVVGVGGVGGVGLPRRTRECINFTRGDLASEMER